MNEDKIRVGSNVSLTEAGVKYITHHHFIMPREIGCVVADQPIYRVVGTGHYFLSACKNPNLDYAVIRWTDRVWIGWFKRHMLQPDYEGNIEDDE